MTAPSSPVPAVERIELPGGWYFQQLNPPHGVLYALRTPKGQGFGVNGTGMSVGRPVVEAFAATLNATPTPGRAAEPDTMGEVERCISTAISEAQIAGQFGEGAFAQHWADKALSAVRTIVTERDAALAEAERLSKEADSDFVNAAIRVMQAHPGFNARDYDQDGISADDFEEFFSEDVKEAWKAYEKWADLAEERQREVDRLRTRAKTAEAQLATLRAEVDKPEGDAGLVLATLKPGKWQVSQVVAALPALPRKRIYNAVNYLTRIGWAKRLRYGVLEIFPTRTLISNPQADR